MDDLRSLRFFAAVAATGSLSAAGKSLGVSQQAVSLRVRALEAELGLTLLERSPRGSRVTEVGALVAAWGVDVLEAADRFTASTRSLRASEPGVLTIAASLTIAEHLLPLWLVAFRRQHPDSELSIQSANSAAVATMVAEGARQLGFIETPDVPHGLRSRTIAYDELVVVVAPAHPWAARSEGITARELASTPLIVRETGSGTRHTLEAALAAAPIGPERCASTPLSEPAAELPSTAAIKVAALTGYAPAVLSILAVRAELAAGTLVRVRLRDLHVIRPLTAIWKPRAVTPPATLTAFLDIAASPASDERWPSA
ncbi:MAG: LysR family transcriptional regulator [Actinobacteria bacterium]|nr:LysR family transcriptional regulator [Actinomycetota bacterium]